MSVQNFTGEDEDIDIIQDRNLPQYGVSGDIYGKQNFQSAYEDDGVELISGYTGGAPKQEYFHSSSDGDIKKIVTLLLLLILFAGCITMWNNFILTFLEKDIHKGVAISSGRWLMYAVVGSGIFILLIHLLNIPIRAFE